MNAWFNLLKKDYRMIRNSALFQLAVLIVAGLWLVYYNRQNLAIVAAPASLMVIFATFYPAGFMFFNVSRELKQTPHLWLHAPQPAWMLLSSKLVTGLTQMVLVLLIAAIFVYMALFGGNITSQTGLAPEKVALFVTEAGAYAALGIIGVSLYMASWATLMAVVGAAVKNILGRYSWLASLAVFFTATWGMGKLHTTLLFEQLTQWGAFKIKLITIKEIVPQYDAATMAPELFAGQIIFVLVVTVALFALSAWLIDNKVEV